MLLIFLIFHPKIIRQTIRYVMYSPSPVIRIHVARHMYHQRVTILMGDLQEDVAHILFKMTNGLKIIKYK